MFLTPLELINRDLSYTQTHKSFRKGRTARYSLPDFVMRSKIVSKRKPYTPV